MKPLLAYLRDLLVSVWGVAGALSVIAFFIPWLATYRPFIVAVAVVAFIVAAYELQERQAARLNEESRHQADEADRALATARVRIAALEADLAEARRPKFTEEARAIVTAAYAKLTREQKVALYYLLAFGDTTDRKALGYLHSKGMAQNYGSIFSGLAETPLVQRVLPGRQQGEGITGYTGNYTITPTLRDALEPLLEHDPEARG